MSALRVQVLGIGLLGPGLPTWAAAREVLSGHAAYQAQPCVVPTPQRLPAAERRRAGLAIKLAIAVADEASAHAGLDPATLATVFASSGGDGANCHALCEALAGADKLLSPTRFTNSVHNAAAGYWHIAVAGREASTSLGAHDASFGAALLEAALQVRQSGRPVLLVCSDTPHPEPLHATRPLPDSVGLALVLAPETFTAPGALGSLSIELVPADAALAPSPCTHAALDTLRQQTPAARALPLFEALARGGRSVTLIDYQLALRLRVEVVAP